MTDPHAYPRRILLAVTGLSPQIVTETLYALAHREPAFVPTEIRLVTTLEGAERARLTLLDSEDGQFHALCRDYGLTGIRFDAGCITVIGAESGQPLADIRTPEENARAADTLLATVRELTADPEAALHVSIAGGRKTMGFYLGYCLSLCARPQDRLSHVLVSEPFESHPQFFFPPARGRVLYTRDNRPVHTGDARVTLADIPFVRLRRGVPEVLLAGGAGFGETVAATEEALPFSELRVDLAGRELRCGGKAVVLPPMLLAWYAWMAQNRKAGVAFGGEPGHCRWTDGWQAGFVEVYRGVAGALSGRAEVAEAALEEGAFASAFFAEKNAKVNRALVQALGEAAAAPYRVVASGRKPRTRYGLALAPGQIAVA